MSRARTWLRIVRFELISVGILGAAALLCLVLAANLGIFFDAPAACLANPEASPECLLHGEAIGAFQSARQNLAGLGLVGVAALPILAGLVVGISIVGREIDQRTTQFAWSVAPSRRRWLVVRLAPPAIALFSVSLVAGLGADALLRLVPLGIDPAGSFEAMASRGVVPAGIAVSVLGGSLLIGAVIGRVLPALLLALALAGAATYAFGNVNARWLDHETILVPVLAERAGREVDQRFLTPDGTLIGFDEAYARFGFEDPILQDPARTLVVLNPAEIAGLASLRLALLHLAAGLLLMTLAFAVVERRRP